MDKDFVLVPADIFWDMLRMLMKPPIGLQNGVCLPPWQAQGIDELLKKTAKEKEAKNEEEDD